MRPLPILGLALLLAACSKKPPAETERKEPWLAQSPDAAPALAAHYSIAERCSVSVDLRAKEAAPRGTFRVCKGEIDVDLLDLARTKAKLSVDLGSIEMLGESADAGRSDELTQEAQNWLDLGSSRPEAERERLRWATFNLRSIEDASAPAAHLGKVDRTAEPREPAAPADEDAAPAKTEQRAVILNAKGSLRIHDVEVDVTVPLRVLFHYTGRASASAVPARLTLAARHAIVVSLRAHDIKPRDSAGLFQSQSMKLIGSRVGAEARALPEMSALLRPP